MHKSRIEEFIALLTSRDESGERRLWNFSRPNDHDSSEFPVSVKIAMKRYVDHDSPFILRCVHKMNYARAIAIGQSDMFSEPLWSVTADADDVAVLNV